MKHDIWALVLVAGAFYCGKFRQWWNSRHDRKVNEAVQTLADKFGKPTDKNGG